MILEIEPDYEQVTEICSNFRIRKYVTIIFDRYLKIIKLFSTDATKNNFKTEAKKSSILYISGLGHGSEKQYTGHNGEVLLDSDNLDSDLVSGKIIHLLSCQVGENLGGEVVKKGALAFFGYRKNFTFMLTTNFNGDIIDDPVIDPFMRADAEIDHAVLEGLTATEVHSRVIDMYEDLIDEWMERDEDVAATLLWDLTYFCSPVVGTKWGDRGARIEWIHGMLSSAQEMLLQTSES